MRREKDTGILGRRKNDKRRFKLITETSTIRLDITINKFCSWWCLEITNKKLDSVHRHWEFNQREGNKKNRHTQPISQFHRAHCKDISTPLQNKSKTNNISQFIRTVQQRLRLMQASSPRRLNLVQL